ncbi:hypothetical protein IEO21_09936 [Rhodonia placenta]|nr:hypothetical protein IEO21_09936 [Postia placenta]
MIRAPSRWLDVQSYGMGGLFLNVWTGVQPWFDGCGM